MSDTEGRGELSCDEDLEAAKRDLTRYGRDYYVDSAKKAPSWAHSGAEGPTGPPIKVHQHADSSFHGSLVSASNLGAFSGGSKYVCMSRTLLYDSFGEPGEKEDSKPLTGISSDAEKEDIVFGSHEKNIGAYDLSLGFLGGGNENHPQRFNSITSDFGHLNPSLCSESHQAVSFERSLIRQNSLRLSQRSKVSPVFCLNPLYEEAPQNIPPAPQPHRIPPTKPSTDNSSDYFSSYESLPPSFGGLNREGGLRVPPPRVTEYVLEGVPSTLRSHYSQRSHGRPKRPRQGFSNLSVDMIF